MKLKTRKIIYSLLIIIGSILLALSLYAKNAFGGAQFAQIIFTLILPEGSSFDVVLSGVLYCVPIVLLVSIVLLTPIIIKVKIKGEVLTLPYMRGMYTAFITILLAVYSFGSMGLFTYLEDELSQSDFIEKYYVNPKDVKITFPENKKNLIYIFMESMEASYADMVIDDKKVNLIPNLTKLAKENINFSNTDGVGGAYNYPLTNWTAAGTVAQISGLPLRARLNLNDYGKDGHFMPKAVMLGDILKENGYHNYYLIGSDAKFGAHDDLFTEHGSYEIKDYYYAKDSKMIPEDYYEFWGYEDKKLFAFAKDELLKISKKGEPFSLVMATIDTHPIDGYLDETCKTPYDYHYGNVVSCSDTMLYDFISWLKEQDFYEDTIIVMAGDHISMQTDVVDYLKDVDARTTYNVFINTGKAANNKKRLISPFDMFPTTISALGATIEGDRLGLGTNLFSDKKTLAEEVGYNYFNEEIAKNSKFYYESFFE